MSVDTGLLAVRRSRTEIERLVFLYRSSGMRRSEFCRSNEMAVSTLARHLKKPRSKQVQTDGNGIERSRLLAVELAARARQYIHPTPARTHAHRMGRQASLTVNMRCSDGYSLSRQAHSGD